MDELFTEGIVNSQQIKHLVHSMVPYGPLPLN